MVLHVQHQALTAIDTLNIRMRESARIHCVLYNIMTRMLDPRAQSVSVRAGRNRHAQLAVRARGCAVPESTVLNRCQGSSTCGRVRGWEHGSEDK